MEPTYTNETYATTQGDYGQLVDGYDDSGPYLAAEVAVGHHSQAPVGESPSRKTKGKGKGSSRLPQPEPKRSGKQEKPAERNETGKKKKSSKSKHQDTPQPQPNQSGEPGTPFYTRPGGHQQLETRRHEDQRNGEQLVLPPPPPALPLLYLCNLLQISNTVK